MGERKVEDFESSSSRLLIMSIAGMTMGRFGIEREKYSVVS